MNCKKAQQNIPAYVEHELSPAMVEKMRAHLSDCEACRREVEILQRYLQRMKELPAVAAPENFLDSLHQKLNIPVSKSSEIKVFSPSRTLRKIFHPFWPRVPLEAAGLLATAALVFIILSPTAEIRKPLSTARDETIPVKKVGGNTKDELADVRIAHKARDARRSEEKSVMRIAAGDEERMSEITGKKKTVFSKTPVQSGEPVTLLLAVRIPAPLAPSEKNKIEDNKSAELKYMKKDADLAAAKQYRGPYRGEEMDNGHTALRRTTERLRRIVGYHEGTIINERYNSTTGLLEYLEVNIPSRNFHNFVNDLNKEGTLKGTLPHNVGGKPVNLRMNILRGR